MSITLDYRTAERPRATLARCLKFAATLLVLGLSLTVPIAISVAGIYWDSPMFILLGSVICGVLLAMALLLAAAAVEQFCDLSE